MILKTGAALVLMGIGGTSAFGQTVYYVDDNAPLGGNGTSWSTAFRYLQDALLVVGDGDEIHVAGGTYTPDRDEAGQVTPSDPAASFQLVSGVGVYGGFAGLDDPDAPDVRNLAIYVTILSGDLNGDDVPGGGGGASDCCEAHAGAGCEDSACQDEVCADHPLCCDSEWTTTCALIAQGLCCELCSNRNDCDNSYHVVNGSGTDSTAILDGVTIIAGYTREPASLFAGGGILLDGGSPTLVNCTFLRNLASAGGAVGNFVGSPTMINCAFSGNRAAIDGGAIFNDMSTLTMVNCTLAGNFAPVGAGIRNYTAVTVFLTNCILWGNVAEQATGEAAQIENTASDVTVNYTCIEGWTGLYGGTGNTGEDPRFIDADGPDDMYGTYDDNLRLQDISPVIDAGDNTAVTVATDLDGHPRIVDGNGDEVAVVDMGAYEFQGSGEPIPAVSEWGLLIMVLLGTVAGTVIFRERRETG